MKTHIGRRRLPILLTLAAVLALFAPVTADAQDTTAPTVQSATVDGATLTLTFSEALKTTSVPSVTRFDVSGFDRTTALTAAALKSGDATKVELTLFPAVANDDTGLRVSYTQGNDANPLQDAAGNLVADFSGEQVTNLKVGPIISIFGPAGPLTEGTAASFTVAAIAGRLGDAATLSSDLTVNLSVSEAAGSDFVAAGDEGTKTVVIAAGQNQVTYAVDTVDDGTDEPNGTVTVRVKAGTGYEVGSTNLVSVDVNDDDASGPAVQGAEVDGSTLTLKWRRYISRAP